jgi:hypothetical protein
MLARCSAVVDARGEIQGQAEFDVTAPCGQSCSSMLNQVGRWQPHRPAAMKLTWEKTKKLNV